MKTALLCGSARGMWEDMAAARMLLGEDAHDVCALNIAGVFMDKLDHWFVTSLHKSVGFATAREYGLADRGGYGMMHCPGPATLGPVCPRQRFWPVKTKGTIAIFAILVLSSLEFDRIILAGVPMDDKLGHFYSPPWESAGGMSEVWDIWEENAESLRHRVRSMSGKTQELLGSPDRAWLDRR